VSELGCFLKSSVLLAHFDLQSSSWKTPQTCLLEIGVAGLDTFSESWPRSGLMRNGTLYRLPDLVPRTSANVSGSLLPTPVARSGSGGGQLFLGRRFTRSAEAAAVVADHYCVRKLQSGWRFSDQRGRVVYHPEQAWPETWVEKLAEVCCLDDGVPCGLAGETASQFGNAVVPQIPELIGRAILEKAGV
jgi:hypothetical protein